MNRSLVRLFALLVIPFGIFTASVAHAEDPEPAPSHEADKPAKADEAEKAAPAESAHAAAAGTEGGTHGKEKSEQAAGDPGKHGDAPNAADIPKPSDDGDISAADETEGDHIALLGDPAKYGEWLKALIQKVKNKVLDKTIEKMEAKHAKKMETLSAALGVVSLSGFLLLLMPLFLLKKYPGKGGVLFKFSAIAAFSAVLVLNLFAGVVLLLRAVQGETAKLTDPQVHILTAAFDGIANEAEHLITMGPQLIQPTLDHVSSSDEPLPVVLLENVKTIAKDAEPFISAAQWFKGVTWIFEYVPVVMTLVAITLFVLGARPILVELIKLPARAAAGDDTKGVVKTAFKFVGNELLATLCLIAALIIVTLVSAEALATAVTPAVETFLTTFFVDVLYVATPNASSGLIFGSLGGTIVFLALNVLILLVGNAFFLSKVHKIFQAKFQKKIPVRAHKKFWLWGTLAWAWVLLFPMLFMLAADPVLEKISEKGFAKEQPSWGLVLSATPLTLVVGFLVLFWAVRGLKGLVYLFKYKPDQIGVDGTAAPPAAPEPAA